MSPTPKTDPQVFQILFDLLQTPRTVAELAEALVVTPRSVYRYLTKLERKGITVQASLSRPTKYHV